MIAPSKSLLGGAGTAGPHVLAAKRPAVPQLAPVDREALEQNAKAISMLAKKFQRSPRP